MTVKRRIPLLDSVKLKLILLFIFEDISPFCEATDTLTFSSPLRVSKARKFSAFRASSLEIKSELSLTYYLHEAESIAVLSVLIVSDPSVVLFHDQLVLVCSFYNCSDENGKNTENDCQCVILSII